MVRVLERTRNTLIGKQFRMSQDPSNGYEAYVNTAAALTRNVCVQVEH